MNFKFMCLSAYGQLKLANERAWISVVIVKTVIDVRLFCRESIQSSWRSHTPRFQKIINAWLIKHGITHLSCYLDVFSFWIHRNQFKRLVRYRCLAYKPCSMDAILYRLGHQAFFEKEEAGANYTHSVGVRRNCHLSTPLLEFAFDRKCPGRKGDTKVKTKVCNPLVN